MIVEVRVKVIQQDMSLSEVSATVAGKVEQALRDVPFATEVQEVSVERETF